MGIVIQKSWIIACIVLVVFSACSSQKKELSDASEQVLINQMGYETTSAKKALIKANVDAFELIDVKGNVVFKGKTGAEKFWNLSGNSVREADFSDFKQQGLFRICINGNACSSVFGIRENPYEGLADAALKSYYYARCGVPISEELGGQWSWSAGHPDTAVMVHASAADNNRPEGTLLSLPGGWYDAGDYGKYIVNGSITTWTLLQSLTFNEAFHKKQNLNIPESANNLPDILDEALVNLEWMMTMQDPNDGGVYHKLTTKAFDGFIMPAETHKQRYVVQKSTSAALDYTSTMAKASRVIHNYGLQEMANKMEQSAQDAWSWALEHPDISYIQPEDISTGAYNDTSLIDEWFWAAAEMYLTTGNKQALALLKENYQKPISPKWDVVNTLGVISILNSEKRGEFIEMEKDFIAYVDLMLAKEKASPYLVSIDKFAWGSNSDVANDGMLKLIAYAITGEDKYVVSARNDLDYILGRNATGYCFVTGFGSKSPTVPHNRIMSADGVTEPIPGYIVGGPNTIVLDDCKPKVVERSEFPAASYTDTECSYSTNETAINWNAPLVFLSSGLNN
jgi:endoglucanase